MSDRFRPRNEADVIKDARTIRAKGQPNYFDEYDLAVDYLKNKQVDDVEQQLLERRPETQQGDIGQQIYPITMPMTEKFVAEAANAYNKPVKRVLTLPDGSETDATREQTDKMNAALERSRYDEVMHQNERMIVLLGTSCVWYQRKRGKMASIVTKPHLTRPVLPDEPEHSFDPSDQDDYQGFFIQLASDEEDRDKTRWAYSTNYSTWVLKGDRAGPIEPVDEIKNPFIWEHDDEMPNGNAGTVKAPGQMLTYWHDTINADELIVDRDATIARANRELNIAWSLLLDTVEFEGHSTPVYRSANPNNAQAYMRHGSRFPAVIGLEETYEMVNGAAPYTETMEILQKFAKVNAVLGRQNPGDYASDGVGPESGFAKAVANMPKLEAREERIRALTHHEEQVAFPRYRAILISTGEMDEVANGMVLKVKFADVEFPTTEDEKTKRLDRRIKHNLTTPAKELAAELGISEEEAQEKIDANREANRGVQQEQQPAPFGQPQPRQIGAGLSRLVAQRTSQRREDEPEEG